MDDRVYVVSELRARYPEGTEVSLFNIEGLPLNSKGVVDFIDDMGFIFIETPEGYKNVVLKPCDENVFFIKSQDGISLEERINGAMSRYVNQRGAAEPIFLEEPGK